MSHILLITVRLHDSRFHGMGEGDGPPSPGRLFQALVAGMGLGGPLASQDSEALEWLEGLDPPVIASPLMMDGQEVKNYVPNNDFDAVGGDPRRVGEIRDAKIIKPRVFDAAIPFMYAWAFGDDDVCNLQARMICSLAERLYQFGRGVDLAWAWGEVLDSDEIEARLSSYPEHVYRPSKGVSRQMLECPQSGSLRSLKTRYAAANLRFRAQRQGKTAKQLFSQPPHPLFLQVAYDGPPLRPCTNSDWAPAKRRLAWATRAARQILSYGCVMVQLNGCVRLCPRNSRISSASWSGVRLTAPMMDQRLHVPGSCPCHQSDTPTPIAGFDVFWLRFRRGARFVLTMCNGLSPASTRRPGNWSDGVLDRHADCRREDVCPLRHRGSHFMHMAYRDPRLPAGASATAQDRPATSGDGGKGRCRTWRGAGPRGRIGPTSLAPIGNTRCAEVIRVQREPFEVGGERVEEFAPGTRFPKERLWHVEITFTEPISGPLVIGDGRFLGLGAMAAARRTSRRFGRIAGFRGVIWNDGGT